MKKLALIMLVALATFACKNAPENSASVEDPNIALFKENSKVIQKSFDSFVKNDLDAWSETVSDTATFDSPMLGDTAVTKVGWRKNLEGFHAITKEFKITKVVYLPSVDSLTLKPNGGVRAFVQWDNVLLNGDKIKAKYFAYFRFNSDHKVVLADEYFDVGTYVKLATEAAAKVK